jgi:hypothetical protein
VPTVIDSFYLLALGSYRALYILNWIEREFDDFWKPDAISVTFGIIQTLLYLDFAWVYWTRQRVKLRYGGVIDSDDLRRGWILSRIFGRPSMNVDDDEEGRPAIDGEDGEGRPAPKRNGRSKWGSRGISVSADDTLLANERQSQRDADISIDAPDAKMKDPDELARALEDGDEDDEEVPPARVADSNTGSIGSGGEWRR